MKDPFERYAERFEIDPPHPTKIGRRYYLVSPEVLEVHKRTGQDAFGIGLQIGEERGSEFIPTPGFLTLLVKSPRKITINESSEWLFTCGRDVFEKNITKLTPSGAISGFFAIENSRGEILGIGELANDKHGGQGRIVKNILDIGVFLRKEH
jgi:ribosome biogenesis protein Nip4